MCKMNSVALQGTKFLVVPTSIDAIQSIKHQSSVPFVFPSFRHRCCLDNIIDFSIEEVRHRSYHEGSVFCDSYVSKHTIIQGGSMFPQYGHTLHDFVMSVFAHKQSLKGTA